MDTIFSHGKLLLTAEYSILDGALALAVPTQLGQELKVKVDDIGNNKIFWHTHHQGKPWLWIEIDFENWDIIETNLPENALFILKTLQNIQGLSPDFWQKGKDYFISTNLQFPANFGLGSSSTLMANLAKWAKVDAFAINEKSLGGSGYDIAVAMEQSAILYQLEGKNRSIIPIDFNPKFKNELVFIHLNQKQDSREGIRLYQSQNRPKIWVEEFSEITKSVLECEDLASFSSLMELHEQRLSQFLGLEKVKQKYFADCPNFVKSLGAWGGDFVMSSKFEGYEDYFNNKGFGTLFSWEEMIL